MTGCHPSEMESLKGILDVFDYNLNPNASGAALLGKIRSLVFSKKWSLNFFQTGPHQKDAVYSRLHWLR